MTVVDNRVVEMEFDNSNFESNVRTSMKTINDLNKSLQMSGAETGIENINAAINHTDLSGIAAGVDAIQSHFSTMGIIGMQVIRNLTDSAMNFANKTLKFLSSGVIQGGINRAMNLEKAHFQLQGILKDEEQVQAVMKNVNDSVDGTAYSLDQAAVVASQFVATGMESGEQMYGALRGVAGLAATASADYSRVGQIFTQVAGQGRLMGNDLLQLSTLGINAAATLGQVGKYAGKTEAEIRDLVSKGKISFAEFAEAMDLAFGDHAKKANETLTGSLSNVKAALSRIGAEFVSPLIVQNGVLVKFLNTIRERINDVKAEIGPFAELFVSSISSIVTKMTEFAASFKVDNYVKAFYQVILSVKNILDGLLSIVKPIGQAFADIFPPIASETILSYAKNLEQLTSKFKLSDKAAEKLRSTFRGLFSIASGIATLLGKVIGSIASVVSDFDVAGMMFGITSSFEEFGNKIKNFFDTISSGVGGSITKILGNIAEAFKNAGDAISNFFNNNAVIEGGALALVVYWIRRVILVLRNFMREVKSFGGLDATRDMLAQLTDTLFQMENKLRYDAILNIAVAIAVLAGALLLLSTVDEEDVAKGLSAIVIMIGALTVAMGKIAPMLKSFSKSGAGFMGLIDAFGQIAIIGELSNAMVKLAVSVLLLSFAVKQMAGIDWGGLARGLTGVGVLLAELAIFTKKMDGVKLRNSVFGVINLALGLILLSQAVKMLAGIGWQGLLVGLGGLAVLLTELGVFVNLLNGKASGFMRIATGMIFLGAALNIMAVALKSFGSMDLVSIGKGLLAMGASLVIIAGAMRMMPKDLFMSSNGFFTVAIAMATLVKAFASFGNMSWESIAHGLVAMGGSLAVLAAGLHMMTGTTAGSAALVIAALALLALAPAMKTLGGISWSGIAKGLVALSGAFIVVGLAGVILGPLVPTLLALSAAIAVLGLSVLAFGAGLALAGTGLVSLAAGLTAFAGSLAASADVILLGLSSVIFGLIDFIPALAEHLAEGLVRIVVVLGEQAPLLADSLLKIFIGVFESLANNTGKLVDSLLRFFINVFDSLAERIPEIVVSIVNFVGKLFEGIVKAFEQVDPSSMLQGVLAVGIFAVVVRLLAGILPFIPSAMAGVLGLGVIAAELAVVIAALGSLAQLPGLKWLVDEGAGLLKSIGNAIGQFVGGIVGGVAEGMSSSLPAIASNLSTFMQNLKPFIDGASRINPSLIDGVKSLADVIIALTAADVVSSIASFITGGNSLSDFAKQLVPFGNGMKAFGTAVSGINASQIVASAAAAKALVEVANAIPPEGGFWNVIDGNKDLSSFGKKLVPFGISMKLYSVAVAGINASQIVASATAAKALVEVANAIPAEGGFWSIIDGNKDLVGFGQKLVPFGLSMRMYSVAVAGINTAAITASVYAAKSLIEVANAIPSEGGFWSLVNGEKDLSSFGDKLVPFGRSMKTYASVVTGINSAAISASVSAAHALIEVANAIPPEGGFWSLVNGEKDLGSFGAKLVPFGYGMKAYSIAVSGINTTSIVASATAAQAIVAVANAIPPEGGFWSLVNGEKDLGSFGAKLIPFGLGMKAYATAVDGINATAIVTSASAAHALVSVANAIPPEGSFWSLIDGERDLASFGTKLVPFGIGMKSYASAVDGINTTAIVTSAFAAHAIVAVANAIPSEGGFWSLVDGGKDLGSFGTKLIPFGAGMKSYANAVAGLNVASIVASASAARAVVTIADSIPNEGGFWGWVNGEKDLGSFGKKLVPFGEGMKSYATSVMGLNVGAITASLPAARSTVGIAQVIPSNFTIGGSVETMSNISAKLKAFGSAMKSYSVSVTGVNTAAITSSVAAAKGLVSLVNSTAGINITGVSAFVTAINTLGKANVSKFVSAFSNATPQMASAGKNLMNALLQGMHSGQSSVIAFAGTVVTSTVSNIQSRSFAFQVGGRALMLQLVTGMRSVNSMVIEAATSSLSGAVTSIQSYYYSFYSAGSYISSGLAAGIRSQLSNARSAANALAAAAEAATRARLRINSPSKVFKEIGSGIPEGLILGMYMYSRGIKNAANSMANNAINSTQFAMNRVDSILSGDMDTQPTIRPVVDLSNVKSGAAAINGLFSNGPQVNLNGNISAIDSLMRNRNQNGVNDDIVNAIGELRKDVGSLSTNSYTINGVTYDGGSEVANAIETLTRYAIMERRV